LKVPFTCLNARLDNGHSSGGGGGALVRRRTAGTARAQYVLGARQFVARSPTQLNPKLADMQTESARASGCAALRRMKDEGTDTPEITST